MFDESMGWFFSDNDLLAEIDRHGGWYGIAADARCEHVDGGSQTTGAPCGTGVMADNYARDEATFMAKWGARRAEPWEKDLLACNTP